MNYRTFGRLAWPVSEVGYGLWGMGGWSGSDDEESMASIERSIALGCTFFDTARVYGDGKSEQLTDTRAGSMHYHPAPSPDGKWLLYGSKRDGVRNLYLMRLEDRKERRLTDLAKGRAAMWPHWQPAANKP